MTALQRMLAPAGSNVISATASRTRKFGVRAERSMELLHRVGLKQNAGATRADGPTARGEEGTARDTPRPANQVAPLLPRAAKSGKVVSNEWVYQLELEALRKIRLALRGYEETEGDGLDLNSIPEFSRAFAEAMEICRARDELRRLEFLAEQGRLVISEPDGRRFLVEGLR